MRQRKIYIRFIPQKLTLRNVTVKKVSQIMYFNFELCFLRGHNQSGFSPLIEVAVCGLVVLASMYDLWTNVNKYGPTKHSLGFSSSVLTVVHALHS